MHFYVANPMSRAKIRETVLYLRDTFGLSKDLYFPVMEFLEFGMEQVDKKFSYEILTRKEMGSCYGITYPEKNLITLREDVYDRAVEGVPRDRFTVAHEIAHYLLHSPKTVAYARAKGKESVPAYLDPEWQANAFAGEILAPPDLIRGMTAAEVERYCGVSRPVAEIQLKLT